MQESTPEPIGCGVMIGVKTRSIANFTGSTVNYVQNGGTANNMKNKKGGIMLIFFIPIVLLSSAVVLMSIANRLRTGRTGTKFEQWCSRHEGVWGFSACVSIGLFVMALVFLIGNHIDYASFPSEYESVKVTLNVARADNSNDSLDIERAAVLHKVIDMNKKLAKAKYWNSSIWIGWFWPDKMAELEYIK